MARLEVNIGALKLKNPVMTASGTFGYGLEFQDFMNCVGLQNKGVDYFAEHIYPQIKDIDTNMIVNVSGSSPEDYAECAARVDALDGIPAIELNISCPNVKDGGMAFGVTCAGAASVVRALPVPARRRAPTPCRSSTR